MKFTFAPEATPLAGFTIKRAIDRGGFGEVYYALSDSGKEVALKLLQRNQQVELRGVSQCLNLKHPNLVTIFDIKTDADGDHWVVMEYVSGKSLEAVLDEYPQGLPLAEVEDWLTGIASGTAFLHDRGIVHRDLKPANVFRENGVVKIGDVGLSKFITPSRRSAQTESVGTVYYMAPEVAHGKYGSELDVYSAGIMLYEMLTGHVPFSGESTGEILMKHLTEPPDLSKIPAQFRAVVGRALEKDPRQRTPGAAQLLEEFRRARQGKPVAEEIPASHFVDVQRLERRGTLERQEPLAAGARRLNGNGETIHFGTRGAADALDNPFPIPGPPAPPPPFASRGSSQATGGWQQFADEVRKRPWLAIVLVVGIVTVLPQVRLLRGGPGVAFRELFVLGGLSALTYFVVTKVIGKRSSSGAERRGGRASFAPRPGDDRMGRARDLGARGERAPLAPRPVAESPPSPAAHAAPAELPLVSPVAPPRRCAPPPIPPRKVVSFSPGTEREISLRTRLSDLAGSMTMAVLWAALATAGISGLAGHLPMLQASENGLFANPAGLGLFGLTTLLGAWAVLVSSKLLEGSGTDTRQRRLILTALGAAVGACAFWLNETLLVTVPFHSSFPGLVRHIGGHQLLTSYPSVQPTLIAYVLFFAALFGIRRWWWMADAFRPRRFRLGSLIFTGLVAFLIPAAFAFEQNLGVLWGLAMSAVVQLSAPWVAAKNRAALVEIRPDSGGSPA